MVIDKSKTQKSNCLLAADGKIPGFKAGASWRFCQSEIDRWIIQQEQKTDQAK